MATRTVWYRTMRSGGLTATMHAYVEFGTKEEAERCRREGTLPEGVDFSWQLGAPSDTSERIVEMYLKVTPERVIR